MRIVTVKPFYDKKTKRFIGADESFSVSDARGNELIDKGFAVNGVARPTPDDDLSDSEGTGEDNGD